MTRSQSLRESGRFVRCETGGKVRVGLSRNPFVNQVVSFIIDHAIMLGSGIDAVAIPS